MPKKATLLLPMSLEYSFLWGQSAPLAWHYRSFFNLHELQSTFFVHFGKLPSPQGFVPGNEEISTAILRIVIEIYIFYENWSTETFGKETVTETNRSDIQTDPAGEKPMGGLEKFFCILTRMSNKMKIPL
jgi:hypothetical protein